MKPLLKSLLCFGLLAVVYPGIAAGQLTWTPMQVDLGEIARDKLIELDFTFANESAGSVGIWKITTPAHITAANLSKRTYAPGAGGRIAITVDPQHLPKGKQTLEIEVGLTHRPSDPDVLKIDLALPTAPKRVVKPWAKVSPRVLIWRKGEKPQSKTATIEIVRAEPIQLAKVKLMGPDKVQEQWAITLKPVEAGRKYQLTVKPKSTDTRAFGRLELVDDQGRRIRRAGHPLVAVLPPEQATQPAPDAPDSQDAQDSDTEASRDSSSDDQISGQNAEGRN
jgi:hypothetical protein